MPDVNRADRKATPSLRHWPGIVAVSSLWLAAGASAAEPHPGHAEALPQAGRAAEEVVLFEQLPDAGSSPVDAQLGLARAYYALGEYGRARIEFENVFRFDNLPRDLHGKAEIYDRAAADYASGRRWRAFHYTEAGFGIYRENSSSSTDLNGAAGDHAAFLPIRVGGGWNSSLTERHWLSGTLDYRFRTHDADGRRNDSDLRWSVDLSRPGDDDNLRLGTRGRVSYRGDGQYRNDWGGFADYRRGFGADDQVTVGIEVSERRYPSGPLRSRTRDIATLTGSWTHSMADGRTSLTFGGLLTQEWATQGRPDGDGSFWGISGGIDHAFSDVLDGFFWWSYVNESYDDERPDFSTDAALLQVRNDDLWNFGGGLVWRAGSGWSLRPTVEYNWEDSNFDVLAYSSTEVWLTARKDF